MKNNRTEYKNNKERKEKINAIYKNLLHRMASKEELLEYRKNQMSLYEIQLSIWKGFEFNNNLEIRKNLKCDLAINTSLKIYIINLDRRKDRKKKMKEQMNNLNIKNYRFYRALDGSKMNENHFAKYDKIKAIKNHRELSNAEIATAATHIEIMRFIVDNNIPYLLIMEDDAILTIELKNFLTHFDITEDYDFDVLMIGSMSSNYIDNNKIKIQESYTTLLEYNSIIYLKKPVFNIGDTGICEPEYPSRSLDYITGAHGYIVSYEGAKKILATNSPIQMPADLVWNINRDIKLLLTEKNLVLQTSLLIDSDIETERKKLASLIRWDNADHPDFGS